MPPYIFLHTYISHIYIHTPPPIPPQKKHTTHSRDQAFPSPSTRPKHKHTPLSHSRDQAFPSFLASVACPRVAAWLLDSSLKEADLEHGALLARVVAVRPSLFFVFFSLLKKTVNYN